MVPDIAAKGHSFKGAFAYYLHDKRQGEGPHLATADRVAWTETRNLATDGPHTACRIMIATAQQADELKKAAGVKATGRKSNQHVYTYSLAWHPDEAQSLDRAEMLRAVDASLKALQADHLQAVVVCHRDREHPHVHVILNRVDPATGKMHGFSKDRERLSAWAADYERERGLIVTPKRQEKQAQKQESQRQAKHVATPADRPKPAPVPRDKTPAAMLKELSDAQKARHKEEWAKLAADQKARRSAVYDLAGKHIRAAVAQHKEAARPFWSAFYRDDRAERRRFADREGRLSGIVQNCIDAVRGQQIRGDGSDRGFLSMAFNYLTSSTRRRAAFETGRQEAREQLATAMKARLDAEVSRIKTARDQALGQSRTSYTADRAALIERQDAEREKVREAWRQIYAQRGKTPPARLQQREKPTMQRDFDKAGQLPIAKQPQPTQQQRLSTPAPQPTPAGVPAPAPARVQTVPKVDQAKQWAKTPEAAPVLKQQGTPTPPVRKDWNATSAPQQAPAPRKDWNAAQDKAREIKPLPTRERSRDHDRER